MIRRFSQVSFERVLALVLVAVASPLMAAPVTFNKDIAPLMFKNCSECHRPGEVAPFSLLNFDDARKKAKTIAHATETRLMPPWKAEIGFAKFEDERHLTPEQVALFKRWVDDGLIEGDAKDLPPAPKFTSGWHLGEPDAVFQPPEPYHLSAEGRDVYQCFVIPANTTEDRYVSAVEIRPGNRKIVHHVIVFLDNSGAARAKDAATAEPGFVSFGGPGFLPTGSLGGWTPGNESRHLPPGVAMLLPKGADIVLQVHYHKSGKPETDQTKLGIYFSKTPVEKRLRTFPVVQRQINIPPGDSNYVLRASLLIPFDVTLQQILPHMHLVGREMTVTATLPDGSVKNLVRIPDWDFNWQNTYRFADPVKLPRGTRVNLVARYDNSENNLNNPSHPPKPVRRGEQTTDEMCMAFLGFTVDLESISKGKTIPGIPDNLLGIGGAKKSAKR